MCKVGIHVHKVHNDLFLAMTVCSYAAQCYDTGWASILQTCTLQLLVGSQKTEVEISLVKVQDLRSLVYDVMSGVFVIYREVFHGVIRFMW